MKSFTLVSSAVIPLNLNEIDTDQIIPASYLTSVSKEGYGENLFRGLRDSQPDFPLNKSQNQNREILVVGKNFGCGSSREHAVWALNSWGIKVIIGKSFADIFQSNSAKNGLLLITQPDAIVEEIVECAQSNSKFAISVDLQRQQLLVDGREAIEFDYDPFRKHCLLSGLDDIDYIQSKQNELKEFRLLQKSRRFVQAVSPEEI